jgi:tRNA G18 (ribose-2'-O)-methylase SpoU
MILSVTTIETLDLPILEPYRTMKRPLEHRDQGIFLAEGDKVVRRMLESDARMISILCSPRWFIALKSQLEKKLDLIDVYIAEESILETIVGLRLHKCVMAIGKTPKPQAVTDVLAHVQNAPFLVAVDGIMNAENMGVIVRNCAGFCADALLVSDSSCDPYLRRSVRNSMGNIFELPICYEASLVGLLQSVRAAGLRIFAADAHHESIDLETARFDEPCCIVLGSEGTGISEEVTRVCDEAVRIPMRGGFDSFNVASASAVLMYEVQRRRRHRSRL